MENVAIRVKGKVQGVWFRYFTRKKAEELDLCGFVQNEREGSVYLEASGEEEQIKSLIKWCYEGSPLSNVNEVIIEELKIRHNNPFTIKA